MCALFAAFAGAAPLRSLAVNGKSGMFTFTCDRYAKSAVCCGLFVSAKKLWPNHGAFYGPFAAIAAGAVE